MHCLPDSQGNIVNNSSKILSNLKPNSQKLNLPQIPVTSVALKATKKA